MLCPKKVFPVLAMLLLAAFSAGCKSGGPAAATTYSAAASPVLAVEPTYPDVQLAARSSGTTRIANPPPAADPQFCPVTGAKLGSMGEPVLVQVAGQSVYVCCAGCVEKLKQNPYQYLPSLSSGRSSTSLGQAGAAGSSQKKRSGSGCGGGCGSGCH